MKKKSLFGLLICLIFIATMSSSVMAYESNDILSSTGECITFSVNDMIEIDEGIYYIEIPLNTYVVANDSANTNSLYGADCSYQFVTTLNAKYYVGSLSMQTGVTVRRISGTGLIKSMETVLSYKQYNNDGTYIQSSSATESDNYLIPGITKTLSHNFEYIVFDNSDEYITLYANGSFQLVDGYGYFSGSNKSVSVIG